MNGRTPLLGLATTRTLLQEIAARMEITQDSAKGREVGRLCRAAVASLDTAVLDYRTVGPEIVPDAGELGWVEQTITLDAIDRTAVKATADNPGWKLLHVGMGDGGQTTLTYGWPWPSGQAS